MMVPNTPKRNNKYWKSDVRAWWQFTYFVEWFRIMNLINRPVTPVTAPGLFEYLELLLFFKYVLAHVAAEQT